MKELQARLGGRKTPVKISVLGCVVNGPGEAREADIGIAAGNGKGVIFRDGEVVRNVLEAEMVDALLEEVERWERDHAGKGTVPTADGRVRLPVLK
jgi:(E)-4-hydroxy-3-methylbut-2-enyl-diphosphate synthase